MSLVEKVPSTVLDEAAVETIRQRRARIACDLLLAKLFKHHPAHAMAALKGVQPHVVDLEPPPAPERVEAKIEVRPPIELLPTDENILDDTVRPTLKTIIGEVGKFYDVTPLELVSQRRRVTTTWPRQVAMYLAREMTLLSTPAIGRMMGNRDHTTVIHGSNKIQDAIKLDERLSDELDVLKLRIRTATLNDFVPAYPQANESADATQPAH